MEEKYYTPDISEFKVGFECEKYDMYFNENAPIEEWRIHVIVEEDFNALSNYLSFYRVKYLDSEDIISLGFNFSHDVYVKNCGDRLLSLVTKDDKIRICEMSNSDKYKVLFYGKFRNKSELKDILEKI